MNGSVQPALRATDAQQLEIEDTIQKSDRIDQLNRKSNLILIKQEWIYEPAGSVWSKGSWCSITRNWRSRRFHFRFLNHYFLFMLFYANDKLLYILLLLNFKLILDCYDTTVQKMHNKDRKNMNKEGCYHTTVVVINKCMYFLRQ